MSPRPKVPPHGRADKTHAKTARQMEQNLRIVGGQYRGRRLVCPKGQDVRPTPDRVRENLFNIIQHRVPLDGASVLDACAGTGILGLEALSRGAAEVLFFDVAPASLCAVHHNIKMLQATAHATVQQVSVLQPPVRRAPVDVVFLDPPYHLNLAGKALQALRHAGWIDAATLCIVEWEMAHAFFVPDGFECIDERHYGRVMISLVALAA